MTGAVLKLATSRGLVMAISFGTAPILGRLFLPQAYGALGVISTVLSILAAFTSLGYVSAIPLAVSPAERRNLFVLCSVMGLLASVAVAAGSFLFADGLAAVFHEPQVSRFMLFLPLMFMALGVRQLLDTTLGSQKRFGAVAVRSVLEIGVTRVSQIGLCFAGLRGSPSALILGSLFGGVVAAVASGVRSIRDVFRDAREPIRLADLRAVAVAHRKFPLVQLWSGTLNALTMGLPSLLLGMRYSVEAVGLYNMAFMMAALPLSLFVGGASQVFYVEAGERVARHESVASATVHLVRVIALLTSLPLMAVLLLGPLVFEVFLGPKWREAGVYAQVLVPWMAWMVLSSPLSVVFAVVGRQGEGFLWNIALLAGRFAALYFGGSAFGVRATLGLFVGVSVALIAGMVWRSLVLLQADWREVLANMARAYAVALALLTPAGILYWVAGARAGSLMALALACAAYAVFVLAYHSDLVKPLLQRLGFGVPVVTRMV